MQPHSRWSYVSTGNHKLIGTAPKGYYVLVPQLVVMVSNVLGFDIAI